MCRTCRASGSGRPTEQVVAVNAQDPGTQNLVWGHPWRSNQEFPGLAYCFGGRSIFWGGWSPRLTPADLGPRPVGEAAWPADAAAYLLANYPSVETEMGVAPTTDYISGTLFERLKARFEAVVGAGQSVEDAPLAVQGAAPESGLFPFDKYSSAYLLFDAVREDIGQRWRSNIDAWRRLMVLPRAQVVRLTTAGNRVTELELRVNDQQQFLRPPLLAPDCTVVLAAGTIESTRLALDSLPGPALGANRMGSNLMAHLRSDITARIRRSAITGPAGSADAIGDGGIARPRHHERRSRISFSGHRERGPGVRCDAVHGGSRPRAAGRLARQPGPRLDRDHAARHRADDRSSQRAAGRREKELDQSRLGERHAHADRACLGQSRTLRRRHGGVAGNGSGRCRSGERLAGNAADIQNININRNKIGTTHHEAGTLWMGDPGQSVTDSFGKFHHLDNVYVAGPALFPVIGSANPSLTATTLARRTADADRGQPHDCPRSGLPAVVHRLAAALADGRRRRLPDAVRHDPGGEARPAGLGLLWYTREVFRNFVLQVDWLSFNPTTNVPGGRADNSGILIRFPALNASNPGSDWQVASDRGYEIQIDDMGFDPTTGQNHSPLHQTGAVYALAPSSTVASKPAGQWNTFEIEARTASIKVTLNGQLVTDYTIPGNSTRGRAGHIGLQCHTGNVQFQNIKIRALPDSA